MTLRELLDAASPRPWEYDDEYYVISTEVADAVCAMVGPADLPDVAADARLIALAPELAALVLDMADALRETGPSFAPWVDPLLARLDRIGQ